MPGAADLALANRWQRGFPLEPRPFGLIARETKLAEGDVLAQFTELKRQGVIDRVGPVFRPNTVGASSLVMVVCPWTLPMDNAIAATIEPSLRMAASTPKATRWS